MGNGVCVVKFSLKPLVPAQLSRLTDLTTTCEWGEDMLAYSEVQTVILERGHLYDACSCFIGVWPRLAPFHPLASGNNKPPQYCSMGVTVGLCMCQKEWQVCLEGLAGERGESLGPLSLPPPASFTSLVHQTSFSLCSHLSNLFFFYSLCHSIFFLFLHAEVLDFSF